MTSEFDIDAFLEQNMPDEKDKLITIELEAEQVLNLGLFLQIKVSLRQVHFDGGEVNPSDRSDQLEDTIAILVGRVDKAIGDEHESCMCFDVSRRELDDLGYELLTSTSTTGRTKFNRAFRKPIYDAFLKSDDVFVANGGLENRELRHEMEGVLSRIK